MSLPRSPSAHCWLRTRAGDTGWVCPGPWAWHLLQCKLQHGLSPLPLDVASALSPVHCRGPLQPADPELQGSSASGSLPTTCCWLLPAGARGAGHPERHLCRCNLSRHMSQLPAAAAQIVAAALYGCCTVCCSPRARRLLSHAGILVYNGLVDLMIPAFNVRPALTCAAAERCQQRCACLSLCSATRLCTS